MDKCLKKIKSYKAIWSNPMLLTQCNQVNKKDCESRQPDLERDLFDVCLPG